MAVVGGVVSSPVSGMAVDASRPQQVGRVVDTAASRLLGRDVSHELQQHARPQQYVYHAANVIFSLLVCAILAAL